MRSAASQPVIDGAYVHRRRRELRLSRRALAEASGISTFRLREIERDGSAHSLRVPELLALADALAAPISKLIPAGASEASPDDIRIEAALLHLGKRTRARALRSALSLSTAEWEAAVENLKARLDGTGIAFVQRASGHCSLEPADGVITDQEIKKLRAHPKRDPSTITVFEADILHRIIFTGTPATDPDTPLTFPEKTALRWLQRVGLVTDSEPPTVPVDVLYGLGLIDRRPHYRRTRPRRP